MFHMLDKMPKGAIHHMHTTASPHIDVYMKLTYDDRVYYNERDNLFKVFPIPGKLNVMDGYLQCT